MVNKEVLFNELCSRLPYEVKCDIGVILMNLNNYETVDSKG